MSYLPHRTWPYPSLAATVLGLVLVSCGTAEAIDAAAIETAARAGSLDQLEAIRNETQVRRLAGPPKARGVVTSSVIVYELGHVKLGMDAGQVQNLRGRPREKSGNRGQRWMYKIGKNEVLIVNFDGDRVSAIYTNAKNFVVPNDLSVGMPVTKFEEVYGEAEWRARREIGVGLWRFNYAFAQLVLIVQQPSGNVYSVMVAAPQ